MLFISRKLGLENILDLHTVIAKNILLKIVERLRHRIISEKLDIATNIRTLPKDARSRMKQWLEGIDRAGMHDVAVRSMQEEWLKDDAKFCLHQEWVSWQYFRLASVLAKEYYYLSQMGGVPGKRRAEHDYQDMEYVLLLSRADGILTRDERLVKPLAQAAFPEKDIFSSLDEVPEEYICHWGKD